MIVIENSYSKLLSDVLILAVCMSNVFLKITFETLINENKTIYPLDINKSMKHRTVSSSRGREIA